MAEDTAVLEQPGTAAGELTPPQPTETDALALATATEGLEQATETQDSTPPDPLEGLTEDDLKAHPKLRQLLEQELKANEFRWRESERQKAIAFAQRQAYEQRTQQAHQLAQGQAHEAIRGIVAAVEEGREYDPGWVDNLTGTLAASAFHEQADLMRQHAIAYAEKRFPQWRVPTDAAEWLTRAWHTGNPEAMVASLYSFIERAAVENAAPKVRAAIEADVRKRYEAAQQTEKMRQAQANRPDGPTAGLPTAGSLAGSSRSVLDSATPGSPQWREAFEREHGFKPDF